jgi:hypothetical protein
MDIVTGFFGLFGLTNIGLWQKQEIKSEISIADAVDAHVKWKLRLQRYCSGVSDEKLDADTVCRDDQCVLGKWIYGPAQNHFHGNACFDKMCSEHASFHMLAGSVVRKMQSGDKLGAEEILDNDYRHTSFRVIKTLTELNRQIECE